MNWKRILLVFLAAWFFALSANAQELSAADKEKALQYLEHTKQGVEDSVKGLSDAQLNWKAAPERWSIAQCLEHIATAEDFLRGVITEKVMKEPAAPGRDTAKIDADLLKNVPDRSNKLQAPEPLKPTNKYGSPAAAEKHFLESRETTEVLLKNTPDLRQHALALFSDVKMDAYEWILLIAGHSERHTKQIEEVKANPNFPKT